jgi:hypothetical protein
MKTSLIVLAAGLVTACSSPPPSTQNQAQGPATSTSITITSKSPEAVAHLQKGEVLLDNLRTTCVGTPCAPASLRKRSCTMHEQPSRRRQRWTRTPPRGRTISLPRPQCTTDVDNWWWHRMTWQPPARISTSAREKTRRASGRVSSRLRRPETRGPLPLGSNS